MTAPRTRTPARMSAAAALAVVAVVFGSAALVGCGTDGDDETPAGRASASDDATADADASMTDEGAGSSSATPEPDPTTEPEPVAPEDAEDGTDVDACYDGECQVAVTASTLVSFDPDVVVGSVNIAEVTGSGVTLELMDQDGPYGYTSSGVGGSGSFGNVNTGLIAFEVLGIEDGTAVIGFSPEEM